MRGFFTLSYALLWLVVIIEAVLVREILRGTLWFKRLNADFSRRSESETTTLSVGSPAPDFTATLTWTGKSISTSDLKGGASILVFVAPEDSSSYERLDAAMHAWWHETNGRAYFVCNGSQEACRQLARDHRFNDVAEDQIPVILDEGGQIARSFLIDGTPQAVSLDSDARVRRYGRQVPRDEIEETGSEADHTQAANVAAATPNEGSDSVHAFVSEKPNEETSLPDMQHPEAPPDERPCLWPDDRPYTGAAMARIDTKVACVITRFRLRSAWSLIPFYLAFRRVRRSARKVAGLLQAVFLIEDLHTCYTMSLWKDDCSIVKFGNVREHVDAANSAFGPTYRKDLQRPEIWSAQFRLWAVSAHNLNWEGLDLQTVLGDQWARREKVAQDAFVEEEVVYDR